jgi:hypothetical protein
MTATKMVLENLPANILNLTQRIEMNDAGF